MLFLAVFCGFLAEYQLEHKIEKDREKQFIRSFVEDLKTDTATINRNLLFRKSRLIIPPYDLTMFLCSRTLLIVLTRSKEVISSLKPGLNY